VAARAPEGSAVTARAAEGCAVTASAAEGSTVAARAVATRAAMGGAVVGGDGAGGTVVGLAPTVQWTAAAATTSVVAAPGADGVASGMAGGAPGTFSRARRRCATALHRASHGRRHTGALHTFRHTGALHGGQRPALPGPMATFVTARPLLCSPPHTGAAARHRADRPTQWDRHGADRRHKSGWSRPGRQHDSDPAPAPPPPTHWGDGPPRGGMPPQIGAAPPRATARQQSRHGSSMSPTLGRRRSGRQQDPVFLCTRERACVRQKYVRARRKCF